MKNTARKKRGLYVHVVEDLAAQILSGRIAPGDKIAGEPELLERYDVSRTVIRDALRILSEKGFIEARPRIGTIVREISDWNFLDTEVVEWAVGENGRPDFFDDFMMAREVMEPQIVAVAARQATLADVEAIEVAYDAMVAAYDNNDIDAYRKHDLRFHISILEATNNLVLQQFGGLFQSALNASFIRSTASGMCSKDSLIAHGEILEGIRSRDPERAQQGLYDVISGHHRDVNGRIRQAKATNV